MQIVEPLSLVLEFGRVDSTSDPHGFQFVPQDYFLRHGQGGYDTARFQWTQELLGDLEAVRRPGRDPALVQRLGDTLRQWLKTTSWSAHEARILNAIQQQQPVILSLRFAAAELYALPWELLTLQTTGQHLGEFPSLLLRYAWPEIDARAAGKQTQAEGGRVFFAWSAATGAVPAMEQQQAIARACELASHPFLVERDVLANASIGRIVNALTQAQTAGPPITVLHLLCHGAQSGRGFGLALCGEEGEDVAILDAARLRQILAPFASMVRLIVISACDSANSGELGSHLGSVAQELHRSGFAQVVASRYPLSVAGSIRLCESFYAQLVAEQSSVEESFLAARQKLAEDAAQIDWASLQLYSSFEQDEGRPIQFRPYRGLLPFEPQHRRFYFGCEGEAKLVAETFASLLDRNAPRLLVLAGPSGCGKSSLIFAGSSARMLEQLGPKARLLRLRLGHSPGQSPTAALRAACDADETTDPVLLVIDQFEELFTHEHDANQQRALAALLWQLATASNKKFSIIATLRSDFLDQAAELPLDENGLLLRQVLRSEGHLMVLAQPGHNRLHQMIVKPAQRVGLRFDAGLVERILQDVDSEPGALPLLEHTLDLLWQQREGNHLTQRAYDQLGGVHGAIHAHADALLDSMTPDAQLQAKHLLLWLGTDWNPEHQGTRRRVAIPSLRPASPTQRELFVRVLLRLVEERLIIISRELNADASVTYFVEVAHETLLRKWQRLSRWAQEARPMLDARASFEHWVGEWQQHSTRLQGNQLGYATLLAEKYPQALGLEAYQLLAESEQARKKEEALRQVGLDTLRFVAARSWFGSDYTRLALSLGMASSEYCLAIPGWMEIAFEILHNQVLSIAEKDFETVIYDVAFSPDGEKLAVVLEDGSVQILDGELCESRPLPISHSDRINRVLFASNGECVLTLSKDSTARVTDLRSGEELLCLSGHTDSVDQACWSRDGKLIATASADGTARLFDGESGQQLAVLGGHKSAVVGVAISPDKRRIYTAENDGHVRVFSLEGRGKPTSMLLIEGEEATLALALSADGSRLATGSAQGTVRVYELDNLEQPTVLYGHGDRVWSLQFSPSGDRLLSCGSDRSARLWNLSRRRPPALLLGHQLDVYSASFRSDGQRIVTASADGRVRIWDALRTPLHNPKVVKHLGELPENLLFASSELVLEQESVHTPDGRYVATVRDSREISVEAADGQSEPFGFSVDDAPIRAIRFTPNSEKLIVIANRIYVLSLKTQELTTLPGHSHPISCLAVSANNRWLVTGAYDWKVKVWNLNGDGEHRVLSGHRQVVTLIVPSADCQEIVTVEQGGATRLWLQQGAPIVLLSESRADHVVAVSDDQKIFVTQSSDEDPFYLWDMTPDAADVQKLLRAATPMQLTQDEFRQFFLNKKR